MAAPKIVLGRNYKSFTRAMKKAPEVMMRAMSEGLMKGLFDASQKAVDQYSSYLKTRSGELRRSIAAYPDDSNPFVGYVGYGSVGNVQKYGWQLFDYTARAKSGGYMAIPAGNLTKAGVSRSASPREYKDGFFIRKGGKLLFGISDSGGAFQLLFVLVKQVKGSGLIPDVMESEMPNVAKTAKKEVTDAMRKIGVIK